MNKFLFAFLFILNVQCQGSKVFALDAKKLFYQSKDSVVLIMSFDKNNQPLAIGSGFFINRGESKAYQIQNPSPVKPKILLREHKPNPEPIKPANNIKDHAPKKTPEEPSPEPTFDSILKKLDKLGKVSYEPSIVKKVSFMHLDEGDKDVEQNSPSDKSMLVVNSSNKAKEIMVADNNINGSIIVTNYHVIEGASSVRIKMTDGTVAIIDTVLGIDKDHDLILLETPERGNALTLSNRTPEIGEDVIAIGNPKGLESTLSLGIVSGVRNDSGSVYYQVTAPISPGSSGGPIINDKGKVLGVSTFYVTGGQNLNFAMPSTYIHRLLRSPERTKLTSLPRDKVAKRPRAINKNIRITELDMGSKRFEASLLNLSDNAVKEIRFIAIFYAGKWNPQTREYFKIGQYPVHYMLGKIEKEIPAGLAKRFSRGDYFIKSNWIAEIRILDYEIIGQSGGGLIPTFD